jgi:hypothetical protein
MVKKVAIVAGFVSLAAASILGGGAVTACNGVLGIPAATIVDGGPTDPCTTYCHLVDKNCNGLEYIDYDTCTQLCPVFDQGPAGDTTQNSLSCRTHFANLAATDPSKCAAAGPLGGLVCGNDVCTTFCGLDQFTCNGQYEAYDGGGTECVADCRTGYPQYVLPDGGSSADILLESGNTINCRLYHLEASLSATLGGKMVHCQHTGLPSMTCF